VEHAGSRAAWPAGHRGARARIDDRAGSPRTGHALTWRSLPQHVADALQQHVRAGDKLVDVCSGGGGPVSACQRIMAKRGVNVTWTLVSVAGQCRGHATLHSALNAGVVQTDLYPNRSAFRAASAHNPALTGVMEPVDATDCALPGMRTMFASFHHFAPADARRLLADAVRKEQPIAVLEATRNSLATILFFLVFLPTFVLLSTPLARGVSWRRIFFTYVVPVLPAVTMVRRARALGPARLTAVEPAGRRCFVPAHLLRGRAARAGCASRSATAVSVDVPRAARGSAAARVR
jgi:hypothetical protein